MKQTNQDKEIRKRIIDKMDKDGGMYTYIKFHKLENCLDIPSVNGLIEIDELTEIPILSERKRILDGLEGLKREVYNPREVGKTGAHAVASNQNYGFNECLDQVKELINKQT